uniref:Hairy-related 2 n=1 Tax=Astyanax mexicanus TaxID=7994 RepID=A0A3B1IZL2_ASTMX
MKTLKMEAMATSTFKHRNEKLKLRKPAVEKLRRDRINSSIEKLKLLLKDQLKSKQPSSKLEKADILEMAVTYLKSKTQEQSYTDGFARCLEETAHFLSAHNQLTAEKPALVKNNTGAQTPESCVKTVPVGEKIISGVPQCTLDNAQLWRPW